MTQINSYINFSGECREAMNFYKECLGGELDMQTIEGSPAESFCPPAMKHQILHSTLRNGSLVLMASDMQGPGGFEKGNTVALSLKCSSEDEINQFFSMLSAGGQVLDPLSVKFWGGEFGVLVDRFGIRWMLHYDKNQQ